MAVVHSNPCPLPKCQSPFYLTPTLVVKLDLISKKSSSIYFVHIYSSKQKRPNRNPSEYNNTKPKKKNVWHAYQVQTKEGFKKKYVSILNLHTLIKLWQWQVGDGLSL